MHNNNDFVKPIAINEAEQKILLAQQYLGTSNAEVWIGPGEEGPLDDDDELVKKRREEALQAWQEGRTKRPSGISAFTPNDSSDDKYFEMSISDWPTGYYRFNYHGRADQPTKYGTQLQPEKRDLQYSWAVLSDELLNNPEVKPYIYWEPNGRGWCFRIHIDKQRHVSPAGKEKE